MTHNCNKCSKKLCSKLWTQVSLYSAPDIKNLSTDVFNIWGRYIIDVNFFVGLLYRYKDLVFVSTLLLGRFWLDFRKFCLSSILSLWYFLRDNPTLSPNTVQSLLTTLPTYSHFGFNSHKLNDPICYSQQYNDDHRPVEFVSGHRNTNGEHHVKFTNISYLQFNYIRIQLTQKY